MRVIPPITITPAMLTATNVAEPSPGETVWSGATNYVVGNRVISTVTHRTYEASQPSLNKDPTSSANAGFWNDVGPTNAWAMFDLLRNTGTSRASQIQVTIAPGQRVDSIGLVGLVGDSVTIEQKQGATVIWSKTVSLLSRPTTTWFTYFFGKFRYRTVVAFFDLRVDSGTTVTITVNKATGNAVCGGVVLGMSVYLGRTLHSAEADATNFSKIDRDAFGAATLIQRRSVPKSVVTVRCRKEDVDAILACRDDLNAIPALWSGLDDQDSGYFAALLIVGVYKRFSVNMDQPLEALISLEIEEV